MQMELHVTYFLSGYFHTVCGDSFMLLHVSIIPCVYSSAEVQLMDIPKFIYPFSQVVSSLWLMQR